MSSTDKKSTKKTKRARLGRGLSSLVDTGPIKVDLAETPQETESKQSTNDAGSRDSVDRSGERVLELKIDRVVPNPHQPRRVFDEEALTDLAASIKLHGLMQPIVVRASQDADTYELIAGERRLRAAKIAGLDTIRAVVDDANDHRSAELALIENMQREDLDPIERARGLKHLMDSFGGTQHEVAQRIGISRSGLANIVRLLELEPEIKQWVSEGALSMGHAKVLLSCEDGSHRVGMATQAIADEWSVRELESRITSDQRAASSENADNGGSDAPAVAHPDRVGSVLRDLERSLSEHLGTQVVLKTNRQGTKGRIQIEFYDLDQFDGLLSKIGIHSESL